MNEHRRLLLKFLMGSPLLGLSMCSSPEEKKEAVAKIIGGIQNPGDAINVFDFEALAKQKLPPAHFGYMATGVNDDLTLRANREAFEKVKLRVRRLRDPDPVDTSTVLFGKKWPTPIVIAPVGSQRAFHEEGELATARAARSLNHLQVLSTVSTTSVEDVTKERAAPVWQQLYALTDWGANLSIIKRAEDAGSEAIVLTVDVAAGRKTETERRMALLDLRDCKNCHSVNYFTRKPMVQKIDGIDLESRLTWDYVKRLRDATRLKLIIKGIETAEDAELCLAHGMDGIIVSNHGGRATETGRGTLECLPEITAAIKRKVPVLIDGGFRRGTDIFKALALGADAICIGRPYIWGLASFGQEGVEAVLKILSDEFRMTMGQAGASTVKEINGRFVI